MILGRYFVDETKILTANIGTGGSESSLYVICAGDHHPRVFRAGSIEEAQDWLETIEKAHQVQVLYTATIPDNSTQLGAKHWHIPDPTCADLATELGRFPDIRKNGESHEHT